MFTDQYLRKTQIPAYKGTAENFPVNANAKNNNKFYIKMKFMQPPYSFSWKRGNRTNTISAWPNCSEYESLCVLCTYFNLLDNLNSFVAAKLNLKNLVEKSIRHSSIFVFTNITIFWNSQRKSQNKERNLLS